MALLLGVNAKLYRLSTGTRASWGSATNGIASGAAPSSLDLVDNVGDVTVPLEKEQADVTRRKGGGWKITKGTLKDVSIEFSMINDPADTDLPKFAEAFFGDTTIPLAVLDGLAATTGTQGIWADWEVIKYERGEPLNDAQTITIGIKPGWSSVAPEWVKV